MHWLISIIPIKKALRYQKWINPVLDSFFTALIYFISTKIGFSQKEALLVSVIYIFTPMWFSNLSLGPRITSFTPRLFSEILSNIFFVVTLLPLGLPLWVVIIVGAITGGIAISSTKFGVQALFFLTPIISILIKNVTPIIALLVGLFLSIAVSRGRLLNALKEQLQHLKNYYVKNKNGETPVSNRNSIQKLFKSLDEHNGFVRKLMVIISRMLSENSYAGILLKMPILPIVLFLYSYSKIDTNILIPNHFIMPVVGAVIVFLVVNIPRFLFLGEAERYLNHVAYFIVASFVLLSFKTNMMWLLYCLLGYGVLYWLFESFLLTSFLPNNLNVQKVSDNIVTYLQSIKKEAIILSYPYHAIGFYRLMLETNHKVVYSDLDKKQGARTKKSWYDDDYPYVKLDVLDRMHEELGVNVLIIDNKQLKRKKEGWLPSMLWNKLEIGAPFYTLYTINE